MTRDEVNLATDWAAMEGWNPGLSDAHCYYTADPQGFLVGLLDGEPVATLSVVKYGSSFGFLGFYIVKPAHRGQGFGMQIWNAGLRYLEGCNIGLDGVEAQQENYRKSGFNLAYRNVRYEGISTHSPSPIETIDLTAIPFSSLQAYERPFFPADRSHFTKAWISQPGCHALGIHQDGQLAATGVIRPCRVGYKIGPLLADTPELAEALFLGLQASVPAGAPIFLDVPEVNPAAVALARRHGMQAVFNTARMYTQAPPMLPLDRLYGVTSFEIG